MLLDETDHYTLHRQGRFLVAAFKRPHRVLSTCRVNGGLREDLTHIANHQSCEGIAHSLAMGLKPDAAHAAACAEADLPPAATALMSTAANMQCAVVTRETYAELTVQVVATAGVLGNATRAGDPVWRKVWIWRGPASYIRKSRGRRPSTRRPCWRRRSRCNRNASPSSARRSHRARTPNRTRWRHWRWSGEMVWGFARKWN